MGCQKAVCLEKSSNMLIPVSIPSPSQGVWYIGPFPLRAYAIFILCAIILSYFITTKRYKAKGGDEETVIDCAMIMVVLGIIGARIYHVLTKYQDYFGAGKDPMEILYIWHGGIAIMGAVIGGSLGAIIVIRRKQIRIGAFADAVAPSLLLGQAIGRLGNYFNQEIFGGPTTLPWGLEIDQAHIPSGYLPGTLFHPTFLYEMLWNLTFLVILLLVEKRFRICNGQTFWLYVFFYTAGRAWIEMVRIDSANYIFGIRFNSFAAMCFCVLAIVMIFVLHKQKQNLKAQGLSENLGIYMPSHMIASKEKD